MRVRGNGWARALAALVTWAAAPSGHPARALPWASPPAPAAQSRQPAAQPGALKPVAAAPAQGKGPDKPGVVALYCNTNTTARAGAAGGLAPGGRPAPPDVADPGLSEVARALRRPGPRGVWRTRGSTSHLPPAARPVAPARPPL
jgi:hypothetical protein